jgi:hypothetical protein
MSEVAEAKTDYPKFATQGEEDAYWAKQHIEIEARALAALEDGTARKRVETGQLAELRAKRANATLLVLDPDDARKAVQLAARRGMEYPELVRKLLHEALERELSVAG